jgi:hypothetical protein
MNEAALGQITQPEIAERSPLKAFDRMPNKFEHAPHLTFPAFMDSDTCLTIIGFDFD